MRISVTGNQRGFSLVEVLVTLAIIGACYISIAKGLIENLHLNRRIEETSRNLMTAKQYFIDFNESDQKNIRCREENTGNGLAIRAIEFYDEKDNKLLDFKGYSIENKK